MQENGLEIAIISMAGRFPGARNINEFWQNLCDGVESISSLSDEELRASGIAGSLYQQPSYVKRAGIVEDIELFDASFFGYSAREAEIIDPQQRIFLEIAWEVLESAGYNPYTYEGLIGVFAGASLNTYMLSNLYPHRALLEKIGIYQALVSNDKDFLATRASYKLNLRGPSLSIQTACSTSLVAVHYACQSLLSGECDMALAGGVSLRSPQKVGYVYQEGGIASPDGHCRTFDVKAQGTVTSNGAGVVLLKRLADAVADGNQIYAVIKGSAINNDGGQKSGYTAPSIKGQAEVIRAAHLMAGVQARTIGYIEAHGTATALGDPIEVAALTRAFRADTQESSFCAIGSIKSNIGHTDAAAGIAGLIKAALALKHRQIPPSLHYTQANPNIDFATSPFYVNTQLQSWIPLSDTPLRAGVSSFGIGGTNAHVLLEERADVEAPTAQDTDRSPARDVHILTLSAKSATALERMSENLAADLQQKSHHLADVAYTLHIGREAFPYRRAVICSSSPEDEAIQLLTHPEGKQVLTHHCLPAQSQPALAFLFPGQGTQYEAMALSLYQQEKVFRDVLDYAASFLQPLLHCDILTMLYPPTVPSSQRGSGQLEQTWFAQPALFCVEYALAQLWISWGVVPQALLGQSIGEFVAACLAGVFSLEDALRLVAARARLMQQCVPGALMSVPLSEEEVKPYLNEEIALTGVNGEANCVLGGKQTAIRSLYERCQSQGITAHLLHVSHAFHSPLMEPVATAFVEAVRRVQLHEPVLPYISNVTGRWITPEQATDPAYWGEHLCQPVRLADGIRLLLNEQAYVCLEVGPGQTLTSLARQQSAFSEGSAVFSSLGQRLAIRQEQLHLFTTLARLWLLGMPIDWSAFHQDEQCQRVQLPVYPFERQRYWIEGESSPSLLAAETVGATLFEEHPFQEQMALEAHPQSPARLPTVGTSYVSPSNELEMRMVRLWQEFLGDVPIGIDDSFFDLGGHSLLATQIVSRLCSLSGLTLSLEQFLLHPTIRELASMLDGMQERRGEEVIPIRERSQPFPLSFAQQRMWFLHNLAPESPVYSLPLSLRLKGRVDRGALEQSLIALMQRHEAFRTRIAVDSDMQPSQIIMPSASLALAEVVVEGVTLQEREQRALRLIEEEIARPFRMQEGELFRIKLFCLAQDDSLLFFNIHHILCDGWSVGVLARDLTTCYASYASGKEPSLPLLSIQYADYTLWQREQIQGQRQAELLQYWQQQLANPPERLVLPTDRPYPSSQTYHGALSRFVLDAELAAALYDLSRQEHVTLFILLLAVFMLQLQRYSGQDDILIGSPVAGRTVTETEDLIGCFVNTLVFRGDLTGNPSFHELLQRLRLMAFAAYEHQELPFEYLLEGIDVERTLDKHPLFQVAFVLQNMPMPPLVLPDITISYPVLESHTAKFDLTLLIEEQEDQGIRGHFEYNRDLFDPETIDRFIEHYHLLLRSVVAHPSSSLLMGQEMLTAREKELLHELAQKKQAFPIPDQALHRRFSRMARRYPERVALTSGEQEINYRKLEQRTTQLAHWLVKQGVAQGTLVGIYMERSLEVVVSQLAILKAGGAYLPIDPAYPSERLNFIIQDAHLELVLTQQALLPQLQLEQSPRFFCVDSEWSACASEPEEALEDRTTGDDLAYVIYTSGSTGQPKGVKIPHKNVLRLFKATDHWYQFNEQDVWTFFHSPAFDFSVWEIWGALLYGGRLVIVPYLTSRSPAKMLDLLRQEQVTVLNQTPSAFRELMRAEEASPARTDAAWQLRFVIFGGEALDPASLRSWFERHGEQKPQLVNMYGITETTVHVTYHPLTLADALAQKSSVIGQPIPDLSLLILDRSGRPVPIGVPGELYVGGEGVAQGYLQRDALTQERFVRHPLQPFSSELFYKTGDLVCYLPNGDLVYRGRLDQQVKVRGFRIELGEIEAALRRHPAVEDAVVCLRDEASENPHLVGYLTTKEEPPTVSMIRSFLQQWLPDYMLPTSFVFLEHFPLTPNGKIAYQQLPAPTGERPELGTAVVAPATASEWALQEIWCEVLRLDHIGIHDTFFALGGDSILCLRMLARAQERGFHFTLQDIFHYQTIHTLARLASPSREQEEQFQSLRKLPMLADADRQRLPEGLEDAYPATALQIGMLFHSEYDPQTAIYHDIFSYRLRTPFQETILRQALEAVITRHKILRTAFDLSTYAEPMQLVYRHVPCPLQVDDIRHLPAEQQEEYTRRWFSEEKLRPFDWRQPCLFRVQIHLLDEHSFQYTFSMHHAILDGWSVALVQSELFQTYLDMLKGDYTPAPLPDVEYRDFVALEFLAQSDEKQRLAWEEKLENCVATRFPRRPQAVERRIAVAPAERGKTRRSSISQQLSSEIKRVARQVGVPVKSVLLAAHVRVISMITGQRDILTGLLVNGRPEMPGSDMVPGLFLNTIPLRVQVDMQTWQQLIQEVFSLEQALLPYRRYPMAAIQRDKGQQALFETGFNFTHFHIYKGILGKRDLEIEEASLFEHTNFPFFAHFFLDNEQDHIHFQMDYDASLAELEQIDQIGHYYVRALEALVRDPESYSWTQDLMSSQEVQVQLRQWNPAHIASESPRQRVHHVIEEWAEHEPERIAVVAEGQALSYAELNLQANQLAHCLMKHGVGPESCVTLCLERTPAFIIAALATLKAGGAYLSIDITHPRQRIQFMVEQSQAAVILTQNYIQERLNLQAPVILCLDRDAEAIMRESQENPDQMVDLDNLAYIVYTSGSTGEPKGIQLSHRGLLNLARHYQQTYWIWPGDRLPLVSGLSFDVSAVEPWMALTIGASLYLPREDVRLIPSALRDWVVANQITHLHISTLLGEMFLKESMPADAHFRVLIVGGAVLHVYMPPELPYRLANGYGPAEYTVMTTIASNIPRAAGQTMLPPVGVPIANTQVYLLDWNMQLLPLGAVGEVYIGGVGLARGYTQRPDLTAERFLPHPFSLEPGARLYRTGDLARLLPDGQLEFLGRIDTQIKIRGIRIELGEIERVLNGYPGIQNSVVVAKRDSTNDDYLVAYYQTNGEQQIQPGALRQALRLTLIEAMIPAHFMQVEQIPLTPNGKVDYRALPAPTLELPPSRESYRVPQSDLERQIASVWQDVLHQPYVGIDEPFFELGGHSLSLLRVHDRLQRELSLHVPLIALFQYSTISQLAAYLEETLSEQREQRMEQEGQNRSLAEQRQRTLQRRRHFRQHHVQRETAVE